MKIHRVLVLLVALMMVAGALAQGAAPARPQGGRQGGGMRMGGMGGGMLMIPELQKELKITAAQKASIDKIMKEMQAVPRDKMNRETAEKFMTRMNNVLSATQKTRLKQIQLQMQGGSALLNPDVQKQLGITAAQKTKLGAVRDASQKEMRAKMEAARKANKPIDPTAMQKMRKAQDAKYLAVLSATQKAKWNSMIGKPFAMPAMRARRAGQ
jgi:Spy/CpxP family protein refolding chaperone